MEFSLKYQNQLFMAMIFILEFHANSVSSIWGKKGKPRFQISDFYNGKIVTELEKVKIDNAIIVVQNDRFYYRGNGLVDIIRDPFDRRGMITKLQTFLLDHGFNYRLSYFLDITQPSLISLFFVTIIFLLILTPV